MIIRTILAALAVSLCVTAVVAQSDPVKTRRDLMKQNNDHAKALVEMTRGKKPFDAKVVQAAFAQWADTAQKLPSLFPENSKRTDKKNRASPKIWENKKDFDEKAATFGKAVADNRDKAAASLDGLKAALPVVGDACDACHKDYRLSRR